MKSMLGGYFILKIDILLRMTTRVGDVFMQLKQVICIYTK